MKYFAKFNENGERIETYAADCMPYSYTDLKNMTEFVELTDEEYEKYCAGYIRSTDGKPAERPQSIPTAQQRLAALEADYETAVTELQKALTVAQLRRDTALINEIQADFAALQESYQAEKEEIENGSDDSEEM